MRLLNHRTTSIRREERAWEARARAMPESTGRPKLLPGYKPHLSYKNPLLGKYAYNKSGKRGLRADQVTGGMNRNNLTQKAPSIHISSHTEQSTVSSPGGEPKAQTSRLSGGSPKPTPPSNPLHKEHGSRFDECQHARGFWVGVSDSMHTRCHGDTGSIIRGGAKNPVFRENQTPSRDIRAAEARQTTTGLSSFGQTPGANLESFILPASPGPFAIQSSSEPLLDNSQSIPKENAIRSTSPSKKECASGALFRAIAPSISGATDKPRTGAASLLIKAPRPRVDWMPALFTSIPGMVLGVVSAAGPFVDRLVRAAGHIGDNLRRPHAEHVPFANAHTITAPNGAFIAPIVVNNPIFSPRTRKTVQLKVARAGEQPPE